MKPKTVVLVLLVPFAAVALLGLVNSLANRKVEPAVPPPVASESTTEASAMTHPQPTSSVTNGEASIVATTQQEDMEAQRERELDAISQALIEGSSDPQSVITIGSRLDYPDREVRAAAREAARHLGDTNIIPRLNALVTQLEDPREKVELMDIVAYLEAPLALVDPAPVPQGMAISTNSPTAQPRAPRGPANRRAGTVAPQAKTGNP